jgi:hypothetical protein
MRTIRAVLVVGILAGMGIHAAPADAGPITCVGVAHDLQVTTATVSQALNCMGAGLPHVADASVDDLSTIARFYGTGWQALSVNGNIGAFSGSFQLDPTATAFLCQTGVCSDFIVGIAWEGLVAFFSIGPLTTAQDIDWLVTRFAATRISVYGRPLDPLQAPVVTPEPSTLALMGIGLAAGARALRRRQQARR